MGELAATVLAAGLGRRMGGIPKAALQVDGVSVLERIVHALRGAGVDDISAVIGPYRDQLLPLLERCQVRAVTHCRLGPHLIDSQRLALQSHQERYPDRDLMLVLGDLPLLVEADISLLLGCWADRDHHVQAQVPVVGGVQGHPVLLSSQAVAQILAAPSDYGCREWMRSHASSIKHVQTCARAYVSDLDTPVDLAAVLSSSRSGHFAAAGQPDAAADD